MVSKPAEKCFIDWTRHVRCSGSLKTGVTFRGIFQSQYSHFQIMYCKGMVSKSKYWISENNKGDEYSKMPKNP